MAARLDRPPVPGVRRLSAVDPIRIPLLIAHGANGPRVKQAESEQIEVIPVAEARAGTGTSDAGVGRGARPAG